MNDLALTIPGLSATASPITVQSPNGVGTYSISYLLSTGLTIFIIFAIILTLFFLIYGGIDMISSGGDKQKVVNARHKLTFAVVGLIVVLLSFFIVNLVGGVFGINFFQGQPQPICNGSNCITP